MFVFTTDHAAHDPNRFTLPSDTRPLLGGSGAGRRAACRIAGRRTDELQPRGIMVWTPIARVHDAGYLTFLQTAFARWQAIPGSGPILRAPAYAVRHKARRPDGVAGQAGWYLSSVTAPIVEATWAAAVGSAARRHRCRGRSFLRARPSLTRFAVRRDITRTPTWPAGSATSTMRRSRRNGCSMAGPDLLRSSTSTSITATARSRFSMSAMTCFYVSVHGDPAGLYPWFAGYADETGARQGLGLEP